MGTVDIDDAPLAYDVDGHGERSVAFVHGWCSKAANWDRQVEHFAPRYRVDNILSTMETWGRQIRDTGGYLTPLVRFTFTTQP